jgi:FkbM family methyltransferase
MLYIANDLYVGRALDLYGEYSEGEVELFRRVVQPGSVIVEVGANIGPHTVFLARQVGDAGRVLAFEPQRIVFQILCANLALNNIVNVQCLQQAVGAAARTVFVPGIDYRGKYNYGGLAMDKFTSGEPVALVTLDSLELARCDFLKIDVEGMEQEVLQGAVQTIERLQPIIYLENDKAGKIEDLIRYVDSLGYTMYWHFPRYFSPGNFFQNPDNVFGDLMSANMLCTPDSRRHNVIGLDKVEVPPQTEA